MLIGTLSSCSTSSSDSTADDLKTESYFKLPKNGHGLWISKSYLAHLREFKSPREAQDKELDFLISIRNLDTIMYLSFHEGAAWNIILMESETKGAVYSPDSTTKYDELVFEKNLLVVKGDTFVKTGNSNTESDIIPSINKALVVGDYNDNATSFKSDGTVNGLGGFKEFKILLDYYDMGRNLDLISLKNDSTENWEFYQFNFVSDTLFIRENECANMDNESGDCFELKEGRVIYKLINRQQITAN